MNKIFASIKWILSKNPRIYHWISEIYPYTTTVAGLIRARRGSVDHIKASWSLIRKSDRIIGRPVNITIEPTNRCNLHCPVCETGAGELGRTGSNMSLDDFKRIIDKVVSHTNTLMLYFMGETFLNKYSYEMIRYAKDSGIPFITACTNGDFVNVEKLVSCGLDEVYFQIGGMTQETHEIYRINSNLNKVLGNLKKTLKKKKENHKLMRVACGLILMRHNEHEIETFKNYMTDLGVDEAMIIDPCVRTVEQGQVYLPRNKKHWIYDPDSFEKGRLVPKRTPNNKCSWIYYSTVIQVNGDVVPCCRDPRGVEIMGNILTQDFDDIWNGPRYRDFRSRILNSQAQVGICRLCSSYPASKIS